MRSCFDGAVAECMAVIAIGLPPSQESILILIRAIRLGGGRLGRIWRYILMGHTYDRYFNLNESDCSRKYYKRLS